MSLLATPKTTPPIFNYQPMIQEMIDVYKRMTKTELTDYQTRSIKREIDKVLKSKKMITANTMADILKACAEKVTKPKKHVRFADMELLPRPQAECESEKKLIDEIFKTPLKEMMGIQSITIKGTTTNTEGDVHIDVDKKGRREIYNMVDGKLHGTRYTTNGTGKVISDEIFDKGNLVSMKTYYPSGSLKMYTYLTVTRDMYYELGYYPNGKMRSITTFKLDNGLWKFADTQVEYNEAGEIIPSVKINHSTL